LALPFGYLSLRFLQDRRGFALLNFTGTLIDGVSMIIVFRTSAKVLGSLAASTSAGGEIGERVANKTTPYRGPLVRIAHRNIVRYREGAPPMRVKHRYKFMEGFSAITIG
jgi:hypothetical protein